MSAVSLAADISKAQPHRLAFDMSEVCPAGLVNPGRNDRIRSVFDPPYRLAGAVSRFSTGGGAVAWTRGNRGISPTGEANSEGKNHSLTSDLWVNQSESSCPRTVHKPFQDSCGAKWSRLCPARKTEGKGPIQQGHSLWFFRRAFRLNRTPRKSSRSVLLPLA